MAQVRLRELPVGSMARVIGIRDTHRSYRSKLLSMGLTRGTPLVVERVAPLGDPVHVTVRGFGLSLRGDEADALVLEHLEGEHQDFGFSNRHSRRGGRGGPRRRRHGGRQGETG
ncbi:MAG: ferrous iron transport protein A [Spirochaetaceae bacterium]